jgi:hypothetical protein
MPTLSVPPAADLKKRTQSEVRFPYYNLDSSVEVAEVMHREAGGSCDRSQLASYLKYKSTTNGSFLTRITSAKLFAFVTEAANQLTLTDLGRRVAAPIEANDAARAKAEAFLNVELFRKIFDAYDGQTLPPELGLRNALLTKYGVVEARVGPAIKVMIDSADQAGYFRNGDRTRLVRPIFAGSGVITEKRPPLPPSPTIELKAHLGGNGGGGNGSGGQDTTRIHPAIYGLIADLPAAGQLSPSKRDALVAAFTATVRFLYPDREVSD